MSTLKLDFNERADRLPEWLSGFELEVKDLWQYPNRQALEAQIAVDKGLKTEQVLVTNGGDESIELLFKWAKLTGQSLLIPEPCFSQYTHNQGVWQNECSFVPAKVGLRIDVEAIKRRLQSGQCLVLTRPNNPTGECLDAEVLSGLLDAAEQANARVFLDEAYIEFAELGEEDWFLRPGVVCLRTFSKAFGLAGARVGYLLGDTEWLNAIRGMTMPFNVSAANLQLASQAWSAREQLTAYCQVVGENREQVADYLSTQGMNVCPSKGNFLLMRVSPEWKQLIANVMKKRGIQIKTTLGGLPDCLRITIPYDVAPLMAALQAIFEPVAMAFDMDGVLIDTTLSYDLAIVDTVQSFTGQTISIEQIVGKRSQGGFNNDWVLAQAMIADLGQTETLEDVTDVFQEFYLGTATQRGRFNDEVNLLNDSSTLFDPDKNRAVVTGRPKFEASQGVKQLGIEPAYVISLDDVKNGKPDPEGILWLQQQWQINPALGMYFTGDNVDDMQAGNAAGCICVGIAGGSKTQKNVLYQAGADLVLDDINQLEEMFL